MRPALLLILLIAVCNTQAAILDFFCDGDTLSIEIFPGANPDVIQKLQTATVIVVEQTGFAAIATPKDTTSTSPFLLDSQTPIHVAINPDSLGLDSLLVRDTDYRKILPKDHPWLNRSVKDLLLEMNYTFNDSVRTQPLDYARVASSPLYPDRFFIITQSEGAHFLHGRFVAVGTVIRGMQIISSGDLKIDDVMIRQ